MGAWTTTLEDGQPGAASGAKAPQPFFHRITTRQVAPSDRLDYWRRFFTATFIDESPDSSPPDGYRGELLRSDVDGGIAFVNINADPNVCHFGRRDSDLMLLGYVRSGRGLIQQRREVSVVQPDSGLMLFDCGRPVSLSATRHDMSYLALPRSFVTAAMGVDPAACGGAAFKLPGGGLSPILRAHFDVMVAHGERLDAFEGRATIQAASALAVALLASAGRRRLEDGMFDDALFTAACRYIELNVDNGALTTQGISAAVGCSRAHLYRLFARRDRTVAGYLRDLRLRRAYLLLETRPAQPIGAIAFLCGYTDLSAFDRAFRRKFGMTPGDCRQIAQGRYFEG
ncbi:HTH-type transcriptional activator RhaR [Castellaniella defragrans]